MMLANDVMKWNVLISIKCCFLTSGQMTCGVYTGQFIQTRRLMAIHWVSSSYLCWKLHVPPFWSQRVNICEFFFSQRKKRMSISLQPFSLCLSEISQSFFLFSGEKYTTSETEKVFRYARVQQSTVAYAGDLSWMSNIPNKGAMMKLKHQSNPLLIFVPKWEFWKKYFQRE